MTFRLIAAIAAVAALFAPAFAQDKAPPKATKAQVENVIAGVKNDKAKLAVYCDLLKVQEQYDSIAEKNKDDPKLKDLEKQMDGLMMKLGPDYGRVAFSELDDESSALFDNLASSCH